jgi:hypothetical protein
LDFTISKSEIGVLNYDEIYEILDKLSNIAKKLHTEIIFSDSVSFHKLTYIQNRLPNEISSYMCPNGQICVKKIQSDTGIFYITMNFAIPNFILFRLKMLSSKYHNYGIPIIDISVDITNVSHPNLPVFNLGMYPNIDIVDTNGYYIELLARYIYTKDVKIKNKLEILQKKYNVNPEIANLISKVMKNPEGKYYWKDIENVNTELKYFSTDYQYINGGYFSSQNIFFMIFGCSVTVASAIVSSIYIYIY